MTNVDFSNVGNRQSGKSGGDANANSTSKTGPQVAAGIDFDAGGSAAQNTATASSVGKGGKGGFAGDNSTIGSINIGS